MYSEVNGGRCVPRASRTQELHDPAGAGGDEAVDGVKPPTPV
ncbi:hypothetical protein [Streptomyces sp. NPDC026092]